MNNFLQDNFHVDPFLLDKNSSSKEKQKLKFPNHQNTKRKNKFRRLSLVYWLSPSQPKGFVFCFHLPDLPRQSPCPPSTLYWILQAHSFFWLICKPRLPDLVTTFELFVNQLEHQSWEVWGLGNLTFLQLASYLDKGVCNVFVCTTTLQT
jgi:hypothetical protein